MKSKNKIKRKKTPLCRLYASFLLFLLLFDVVKAFMLTQIGKKKIHEIRFKKRTELLFVPLPTPGSLYILFGWGDGGKLWVSLAIIVMRMKAENFAKWIANAGLKIVRGIVALKMVVRWWEGYGGWIPFRRAEIGR